MKNEQLILLFEMKNIDIIQLENELSKNELLGQIVDNGVINENSAIDYLDIDSMIQLYSYTVNYEDKKYLFYEKVHTLHHIIFPRSKMPERSESDLTIL